jgi:SAM-dependent methyltransferase
MGPVLVVDVSAAALAKSRARSPDAGVIEWRLADVTATDDLGTFDVWHDRAVFHFLTEPRDRAAYTALARRTVAPGGTLIMATFGPEGPSSCSGLPVARYDARGLAGEMAGFDLVDSHEAVHRTPWGVEQQFLWAVFRRQPAPGDAN